MNNLYDNFNWKQCERIIKLALAEDIGKGDITSDLLIEEGHKSKAVLLLKENSVIAGLKIFQKVFEIISSGKINIDFKSKDGILYLKGKKLAYVEGDTKNILKGERVALNILQRMSGIADTTYNLVKKLDNKSIKIIDTRKTTPNFRIFEKLAVKIGGGNNHRMGLHDMILIKDNHINANGGIVNTLKKIRELSVRKFRTEIEVKNLHEFEIVKKYGGNIIKIVMLDNFSFDDIVKSIKLNENEFLIEISGGINPDNIKKFSKLKKGIDFISSGSLTHSYKSTDIALNFIT